MGIRYKKRIKFLPGVYINLSKSGASLSVGKRGASMNFNKNGTYMNAGIPGTGIYSRTKISSSSHQKTMNNQYNAWTAPKQWGCSILLLFTFCGVAFLLCGNVSTSMVTFFTGVLLYAFITRDKSKNKQMSSLPQQNTTEIRKIENIEDSLSDSEGQTSDKDETEIIDEEFKEKLVDRIARGRALYNTEDIDLVSLDPMFDDAAHLIVSSQCGSTSLIQRKYSLSYNRAARIMDQLEKAGIVGPARGAKPREVLILDEVSLANLIMALYSGNSNYTSPDLITRYSLNEDEINARVNYYLEEKEKEEERERLLIEEEKERLKKEILEKRKKREIKKQAMEELKKDGLIDTTRKREPIPQDVQDAVWRRDGGRCVKCGSQENLEFDHIIPFSKGGSNTARNIQLLCEKCNRKKSNNIG